MYLNNIELIYKFIRRTKLKKRSTHKILELCYVCQSYAYLKSKFSPKSRNRNSRNPRNRIPLYTSTKYYYEHRVVLQLLYVPNDGIFKNIKKKTNGELSLFL